MVSTSVAAARPAPSLAAQLTWWVLALPAALVVALASGNLYLLDYTHVLSGALWTGADLFLGLIVGPVMRRLEPPQRQAVIRYLTPRTLLYMPVVAFTTSTAGWVMANRLGFIAPGSPDRPWVGAALLVTFILTVQGLGILLPNNLRIYFQLQRPQPDLERVMRLNRINFRLAAIQGILQVVIILIMAHLVVG
jgi:putative copper export protein